MVDTGRAEKLLVRTLRQKGEKKKKNRQCQYSQHYGMSLKWNVENHPVHLSGHRRKCFPLKKTNLQGIVYPTAAMNLCMKAYIIEEEAVKLRASYGGKCWVIPRLRGEEVKRPGVSLPTPLRLLLLQPVEHSGKTALEGAKRRTVRCLFVFTISCCMLGATNIRARLYICLFSHCCLFECV